MFAKLFDTLANMGIWIRLNDKRTEPPPEEGRIWGPAVGGFIVSLAAESPERLSILIKNLNDTERRARIPAWLHYLKVEVTAPGGASAELKSYGKQALNDSNLARAVERIFPPGKYLATDVPLGSLYDMRARGHYVIQVSCPVPGETAGPVLISNQIDITI